MQFLGATLETVRQWTFSAAAICRPPVGMEDCDDPHVVLEPVSSRMAYRLDFTAGRTRVTQALD